MKAHLTFFQAYRATYRRLLPFAFALAALFTLCAFAQYFFITYQLRATAQTELVTAASRIRREIAFTNSQWRLSDLRHAEFPSGIYHVLTHDNFLIENGGDVPNLVTRVALVGEFVDDKPKTMTTPVGEKWRVLRKPVAGGFVLLGILDLDDDLADLSTADRTLYSDAAKFGSTIAQAAQVNVRQVSAKTHYAVVTDSGGLKTATSCIPLRLLSGPILDAVSGPHAVQIEGTTYSFHFTPILDGSGTGVGQIAVAKDVTADHRAVHKLVFFNVCLGAFCWLVVLLLVGAKTAAADIEKRSLEISLEEALRQGEGQAIEFKEGVSTDNLPPAISAFANTNPGVVFVGVKDDRKVCGVAAATPQEEERLRQKIRDIVQNRVDPLIIPRLTYFDHDGQRVLRISVPQGERPPYLGNGVVYRRVLAAVVPAKADDIRRMR